MGKFQLDTELLLGLGDAEEGRGSQREAHSSFPVSAVLGLGLLSGLSSQTQWGSGHRSVRHQRLCS